MIPVLSLEVKHMKFKLRTKLGYFEGVGKVKILQTWNCPYFLRGIGDF